MTKTCGRCKETKPASEFHKARSRPDGLNWACKSCHAKYNRESDARHREKRAAADADWRRRNPEKAAASRQKSLDANPAKKRATDAVFKAIKSGRLVRPGSCSECGRAASLEAHHDDYHRQLEVRWLCHLCHSALHAALRRETIA
jgi:hypothetical protein